MKKVRLEGLDIVLNEGNKQILIYKDEFSKQFIDPKVDIRIEIISDGKSENGLTTGNLVQGLIVCSNYYLQDGEYPEDDKKYKTKLEKLIKNGVKAKITKLKDSDLIKFSLIINGKDKYNTYGKTFIETMKMIEGYSFLVEKGL